MNDDGSWIEDHARWSSPAVFPLARHVRRRLAVRRQVLDCQTCPLHSTVTSPTPYAGPRTPSFCVIGEAPGPQEERRQIPFCGPSGKLLRAIMRDVGLDPDDVLWLNTVSCHPKKAVNTRTPTEAEQLWCRDNMLDQLQLGNTEYVLLVGATAVKAFRSDIRVTDHHGLIFIWQRRYVVMPIIHPAAALRRQHYKKAIAQDLERWGEILYDRLHLTALSDRCIKCRSGAQYRDPDGVAYCWEHWRKYNGMKTWEKESRRWSKEKNVPLQMTEIVEQVPVVERVKGKRGKKEHA